ncbi:MAG: phosphoenolpyruvate carboxylase [Candidatus Sulfomarinibacteraceae bacterium]
MLTDAIYQTVPAFYDAVRDAVEAQWGEGSAGALTGPEIRFGSWVGGDMDGNPNVNAGTVLTTLERHRELIIARYRTEVRDLFGHLSQSPFRVTALRRRGRQPASHPLGLPLSAEPPPPDVVVRRRRRPRSGRRCPW